VHFSGAVSVTVLGKGFLPIYTTCMFDGDHAMRTVWISSTNVVCFFPQMFPGMHSVSVGHNEFQQSAAEMFEVLGRTAVLKMIPSLIMLVFHVNILLLVTVELKR
jgi:hypothetical protein